MATVLATTIITFKYFTIFGYWRQGEMGLIDGSAVAHRGRCAGRGACLCRNLALSKIFDCRRMAFSIEM